MRHIPIMGSLPFIKMHGLGNDFVVVDARDSGVALDAGWIRGVADRRTGVGCDQFIAIEHSDVADARMTIRNADGTMAEACGNGARCVGALLMAEMERDRITLDTAAGVVECRASGNARVTVDMGAARLDWRDIPLVREADTLHIDLGADAPGAAVGVNLGNPHAVFFVDDAEAVDVAGLGARLERHEMFPERANIEFAQVRAPDHIRMRVWERGTGITRACGTGACATLVAAARRGLTGRDATVELDGGSLHVSWHENGHVMMTGPVAMSFRGVLETAETA